MTDKTNYAQSLMHMIKGNLGAGILAMPATFAHTGIISGTLGLPIICMISMYCVHLLIESTRKLEAGFKGRNLQYASLAKYSFENGPKCLQNSSKIFSRLVDWLLLFTQFGVCCVYLVFIVENLISILGSYQIVVAKLYVFVAILPIVLLLCSIRTLKRLSIASTSANLLQAVGLALVLEYLMRNLDQIDLSKRPNFRPLHDTALGFGSAMFAFEGIGVVIPIYTRMRNPNLMSGCFGVVNVSFIIVLVLYFFVGIFGFLKFGHHVKDSITLNLPAEPLYDSVRAMFTGSILLTYPLQLYVLNEIVWTWVKDNLLMPSVTADLNAVGVIAIVMPKTNATSQAKNQINQTGQMNKSGILAIERPPKLPEAELTRHEYCCRLLLVILTFTVAFSVPKLNLLMDLVGSMSGTVLCLTFPAMIHLACFWNDTKGISKCLFIIRNVTIILISLIAGGFGTIVSFTSILKSFK